MHAQDLFGGLLLINTLIILLHDTQIHEIESPKFPQIRLTLRHKVHWQKFPLQLNIRGGRLGVCTGTAAIICTDSHTIKKHVGCILAGHCREIRMHCLISPPKEQTKSGFNLLISDCMTKPQTWIVCMRVVRV